ncbi:MAG: hypothetical protein AB7P07_08305 [Hyphomonadaceae bacterium]
MSGKWVENGNYFGPDRRRAGQRRLLDRRKQDDARDLPSLGVLLRRLRVQTVAARTDNERDQAIKLAAAAAAQAKKFNQPACVDKIQQAVRFISRSKHDPAALEEAERILNEALASVG